SKYHRERKHEVWFRRGGRWPRNRCDYRKRRVGSKPRAQWRAWSEDNGSTILRGETVQKRTSIACYSFKTTGSREEGYAPTPRHCTVTDSVHVFVNLISLWESQTPLLTCGGAEHGCLPAVHRLD
ncbi:unnamed protein product, partial [Ectocarpus sp. 8 AP-2014]